MRVVIVEDHPVILKVITMALQAVPGYEVLPFGLAEDGLAACDAATDLVILDNHLPDLTGIAAVERLRSQPATRNLPAIVITADSDRATRLAAIRAGANDFLEKPVQIDELRMRVHNLLALRMAQKEASEGQALLETLIEAAGTRMAVADARLPDYPILYASDPMRARTGAPDQGLVGTGLARLWDDTDPSPSRDRLSRALDTGTPGRFVLARPQQGAEPVWVEVALNPVAGPGRSTRYLVASLTDVTDLVETQNAHARLSSRLADIARISAAWFFEMDAGLRLTYVSAAMAEAFGLTPEQVTGISVADLPVRLADPALRGTSPMALFAAPYRPLQQVMMTFRRNDGSIRAVQINATAFFDDDGTFAGYRGHAGDVSEIARARDLAAQASRAKSVFLATMSHEMRTPLTAIVGLSEVADRDEVPETLRGQLDEIRTAALQLSQVLSDVLDVASMEQGRIALNATLFDPVAEVRNAVVALSQTATERGLGFGLDAVGDPGQLRMGDAVRFGAILRALVSNAVKFTLQGSVSVRLDLSDPASIRLSVTDTGIGMTPDELRTAAQPFRQADDGVARRFEGAGLGLSIVTWLVDAMGGQLDITSARDAGTQVRVCLPLPATAPVGTTPPGDPPRADNPDLPQRSLNGCRVLVADDNLTNRRILQAMLRKLGAEVTLCTDGPAALQAWQDQDFDMVLLDINMPQMAGTEVIRAIRGQEALRGGPPVPAVAVTANARPDQVADYRQAGFDDCVAKPFTSADLARKLNRHAFRLVG